MKYRYKCENEEIKVFVWNDNFHTDVSVEDNKTNKMYNRTISEDENGKFFTWKNNKIYINDWTRTSMKELKERFEKKESVTSDELCQAILSDGIENVRFMVPFYRRTGYFMTNKTKDVLCKVEERNLCCVKQNYKLFLVPVFPDETLETYKDFYTLDMVSLIENGYIKIIA